MIYKDVKLDFIADFGECVNIRDIILKSVNHNGVNSKPISATINVCTDYGSFSINDVFLNSISTEHIMSFVTPSVIKFNEYVSNEYVSNAMRIQMGGVSRNVDVDSNNSTDLEKLTSAITNFKKAISELDNVDLMSLQITANKELLTVV